MCFFWFKKAFGALEGESKLNASMVEKDKKILLGSQCDSQPRC